MNRSFHLVSFACLYTSHHFNISEDGLISKSVSIFNHTSILKYAMYPFFKSYIHLVPTENVASIAASATVLEGVSRSRNALLNGNTRDYDWDSGYTCHQLGSGSIVIQLAQPYIISSMR